MDLQMISMIMKMHLDSIEKGDPKLVQWTDIEIIQTAKDRITKEKETDKKKHDKMMDRRGYSQAGQKNMETEEVHRKTVASLEQSRSCQSSCDSRPRDETKDFKICLQQMMIRRFTSEYHGADEKGQSLKVSLIEFDGKKLNSRKGYVAVQQKFNAMRKPTDKKSFSQR